jgi:multidrug resistance protein MdtO
VSCEGAISGVAREDRLLKFLRVELAPTPGRFRATARIVVGLLVATAFVMTCHTPYASFIFITIIIVSQANAGASLAKAMWRVLGTIAGAAVGLVAYVSFLDHPWLLVGLLGPLAAFFIFLSQTTTTPYFGLLGGITAVLIMTISPHDAESGIHEGLWRFAMILLGSIIGAACQILLWPEDPEKLLYRSLKDRLATIENLLSAIRDGRKTDPAKLDALILTGLSRQLDLLDNAEVRHPSLRTRHSEQLGLIAGIEKLLTGAVAFARTAETHSSNSAPLRERLSAVITNCQRLQRALEARGIAEAPDGLDKLPSDAEVVATGGAALLPGLLDLEGAIYTLPGMTGYVERRRAREYVSTALPNFDSPGRLAFFTPAFSLRNTDAMAFSIQTGIAATLCYVVYQGLAWPGLSTSVWTALLVSQSTLGASVQKAILRVAGACIGGLLGLGTILCVMPNIDNLGPLLLVVTVCAGLAAWVAAGSARTSYVGVQMGLAFALCVLNEPYPTTNLVPPRDRVIGVLLGVGVWAFVNGLMGSVHARTAMRRSVAATLRSLAGLARVGLRGEPALAALAPAMGWRWGVYQNLTTTLRLHDEAKFEWVSDPEEAEAERDLVARVVSDAEAVFLALLALVHHRLSGHLVSSPPPIHEPLQDLAHAIISRLEALANRIQGRSEGTSPALEPLFARVREVSRVVTPTLAPEFQLHVPGRIALYEELLARVSQLDRDVPPPAARTRARITTKAAPANT